MSRKKFQRVQELIEQKEFDKARALLITINHPTADKWLRKLNTVAPAQGKSVRGSSTTLPAWIVPAVGIVVIVGFIFLLLMLNLFRNNNINELPTVVAFNGQQESNTGNLLISPSPASVIGITQQIATATFVPVATEIPRSMTVPEVTTDFTDEPVPVTNTVVIPSPIPSQTPLPVPTNAPQISTQTVERIYFVDSDTYYAYDVNTQNLSVLGDFGDDDIIKAIMSPDGRTLVWRNSDNIYITDVNTWTTQRISSIVAVDAIWALDSSHIIFTSLAGDIYTYYPNSNNEPGLVMTLEQELFFSTIISYRQGIITISGISDSDDPKSIVISIDVNTSAIIEQRNISHAMFSKLNNRGDKIIGGCVDMISENPDWYTCVFDGNYNVISQFAEGYNHSMSPDDIRYAYTQDGSLYIGDINGSVPTLLRSGKHPTWLRHTVEVENVPEPEPVSGGQPLPGNLVTLNANVVDGLVPLATIPITREGNIYSKIINFSSDGQRAYFSDANRVIQWDVYQNQEINTFTDNSNIVSIVIDDSEQLLAYANENGLISIMNLSTQGIQAIIREEGEIYSLDIDRNEHFLLVGTDERTSVWDINTGVFITEFQNCGNDVAFSPDNQRVMIACSAVTAYEIASANSVMSASVSYAQVSSSRNLYALRSIAMEITDSNRLVIVPTGGEGTATYYGIIQSFNATTGELLNSYPGNRNASVDASLSPDEQLLVGVGRRDDVLLFWTIEGELLTQMSGFNNTLAEAQFSPDGRLLMIALDDRIVFYGATGESVAQIVPTATPVPLQASTAHIAFAGRGTQGNGIYVSNIDGSNLRLLVPGDNYESPVWSPDGTHLAFVDKTNSGDIYVINADGTNWVLLTHYDDNLYSPTQNKSEDNPIWLNNETIMFSSGGGIVLTRADAEPIEDNGHISLNVYYRDAACTNRDMPIGVTTDFQLVFLDDGDLWLTTNEDSRGRPWCGRHTRISDSESISRRANPDISILNRILYLAERNGNYSIYDTGLSGDETHLIDFGTTVIDPRMSWIDANPNHFLFSSQRDGLFGESRLYLGNRSGDFRLLGIDMDVFDPSFNPVFYLNGESVCDSVRGTCVAYSAYIPQATGGASNQTVQTNQININSSASFTCDGTLPSRLVGTTQARVIPGPANNIRSNTSTNARIIGQIPGGSVFSLTGEPTCSEGYIWWNVSFNGQSGWTAEGNANEYWLEPF